MRPAAERSSIRSASLASARLADRLAVGDGRSCRRRAPGARPPSTERALPAACSSGSPPGRLLVVGRDDLEGDRRAAQDRAPLRRGRREEERHRPGTFARDPDLLRGPLPGPLRRHVRVVVVRLRVGREPEPRSAARARSRSRCSRSIHSPCGQVELDAALGPLEPAHPELRAARAASPAASSSRAEDDQRRVAAGRRAGRRGRSSRAASGIQRYGSTQIEAPYSETTRSKLASGRPGRAGVGLDERELDARLGHHPPRGRRAERA